MVRSLGWMYGSIFTTEIRNLSQLGEITRGLCGYAKRSVRSAIFLPSVSVRAASLGQPSHGKTQGLEIIITPGQTEILQFTGIRAACSRGCVHHTRRRCSSCTHSLQNGQLLVSYACRKGRKIRRCNICYGRGKSTRCASIFAHFLSQSAAKAKASKSKSKKLALDAEAELEFNWAVEAVGLVDVFAALCSMKLSKFWSMGIPEEELLNMQLKTSFLLLQNNNITKQKAPKLGLCRCVAVIVSKYPVVVPSAVTSMMHYLNGHEHAVGVLAEILRQSSADHNASYVTAELLRYVRWRAAISTGTGAWAVVGRVTVNPESRCCPAGEAARGQHRRIHGSVHG